MITLLSTPNKYQPAYGNIVLQFSSTAQTANYKYRYVVDIYADNQYITRLKITPQNNSWGQCDISDILRNYVNSNPVNIGCTTPSVINKCEWGYLNEDIINYRAYVGEEYATTENGDIILYTGSISRTTGEPLVGDPDVSWGKSDEKYVFNGVKEWFDGKSYDTSPFYLNQFLPSTQTEPWDSHRYITNAPRIQYVRDGEYATLAGLSPNVVGDITFSEGGVSYVSRPVFSALFEFYDENDALILTGRTYNVEDNCGWRPNCSGSTGDFTPSPNYDKQYISYLGTGPQNIEDNLFGVPDDTKWYRVCLEKSEDLSPGVTPTPTPTPSSTPGAECVCGVYDIYNPNESSCSYQYEPCPGGSFVSGTVPSFTIARVESCSIPTQGPCVGTLEITFVRDCECVAPTPTPTPTPTPSSGTGVTTYVIALDKCSEEVQYVHFNITSPSTPSIGQFFCYGGLVYEVITYGGGGFVNTTISTFYSTYGAAYAVCPCSSTTGDTENCQTSIQISEWFYYYYDGQCSPNSQRIMFQNKLGTFDYYTMRGLDDVGYDVDRQTYTEAPQLYTDGWSSDSYRGWLFNTKVWNNNQSKTGILRTGYIPKSDAIWLAEELLRSPRVYLIDDSGDLEPIVLTNNEVVQPNPDRPGLMEIIVEYTGGYKEIRQNN